jgi:hypothetical protein
MITKAQNLKNTKEDGLIPYAYLTPAGCDFWWSDLCGSNRLHGVSFRGPGEFTLTRGEWGATIKK